MEQTGKNVQTLTPKQEIVHSHTADLSEENQSLIFFLQFSMVQRGKFGSPYLAKAHQPQGAALPIPISVCSVFVCPNNGMVARVWDF